MKIHSYRDYQLIGIKNPIVGVLTVQHQPFSQFAKISYPDGDSEVVIGIDLAKYLELIGVKDAEQMADRIWNFGILHIKMNTTKRSEPAEAVQQQ